MLGDGLSRCWLDARWSPRRGRGPAGILARLLVGMLAALLVAGCGEIYSWNQKMTITVDTPAGRVSGSSVQRGMLSVHDSKWVPPEARGAKGITLGEAVAVEVRPGRYLFALIGASPPNIFHVFFPRQAPVEMVERLQALRRTETVPRAEYPRLVTFDDLADSMSVRAVDPDNLTAVFGPGVAISSITLAVTDEAETKGRIRALLPWLGQDPGAGLGPATGRTENIPFYRRVTHGNFLWR